MAVALPALAIASAVATVGSTAYSFYSQRQQAQAEADYQAEYNHQLNIQAANSYDDLSPATIDANRQANDEALNQQAEAIQAKGRVNVFAAASGTMGGSVDSMLFDIDQQKDKNLNNILLQRESGLFNIRQQAENIRQGAMNGQQRNIINKPSWLEGAFNVGSSAISAFSKLSENKKVGDMLSSRSSSSGIKGGV